MGGIKIGNNHPIIVAKVQKIQNPKFKIQNYFPYFLFF